MARVRNTIDLSAAVGKRPRLLGLGHRRGASVHLGNWRLRPRSSLRLNDDVLAVAIFRPLIGTASSTSTIDVATR